MKSIFVIFLLMASGLRADFYERIVDCKTICRVEEKKLTFADGALNESASLLVSQGWEPFGSAFKENGGSPQYCALCQTFVKKKRISINCPEPEVITKEVVTESLAVTFKDNFFTDVKTLKRGNFTQTRVSIYVVKKGDSLDKLAKTLYGDDNLWPIIFYDNLGNYSPENLQGYVSGEKLLVPDVLPEGLRLRIRTGVDEESKKQVAEWLQEFKK